MNKSKLISVAVLCALALSACVDDKESASVTALREAKTSYLKAQADYQSAQAEVAKINAEVAKAKAEAEAEVAKLKAQAEAAKTEAEAAVLKQQAEAAAKKLEVKLIELEAKAKANAALYEKQYQEYLNELAQAKRDAEKQKQYDLSQIVDKYQTSLANIQGYEQTIQEEELNKVKAEQKKMEVLAGEAYAKVKNDSIDKEAALKNQELALQELEVLYAADAKKQKEIVEAKRAGLAELVQRVNDAYVAKDTKWEEIDAEDGPSDQLTHLKDSMKMAWRTLNAAEAGWLLDEDGYVSSHLNVEGHTNPILGNSVNDFEHEYNNLEGKVQYYAWEADRLITDITAALKKVTVEFEKADTLDKVDVHLKSLFDAFEKAEKAYTDAVKDKEAAQKAFDKLPATATQAERDAAQKKLTDAQTAENLAETKKNNAQNEYTTYRDLVEGLKQGIASLQEEVENYTALLADVKVAKETCFGKLSEEIVAAEKKVDELQEQYADLLNTYNNLKAEYDRDKGIVDAWDSTVKDNNEYNPNYQRDEFLTKVEKKIITAKGAIETLKVQLAHLAQIMSDPNNIIDEYYDYIQEDIDNAEKAIAAAQESLDKEKLLANEYKASIEAWMTGAAE